MAQTGQVQTDRLRTERLQADMPGSRAEQTRQDQIPGKTRPHQPQDHTLDQTPHQTPDQTRTDRLGPRVQTESAQVHVISYWYRFGSTDNVQTDWLRQAESRQTGSELRGSRRTRMGPEQRGPDKTRPQARPGQTRPNRRPDPRPDQIDLALGSRLRVPRCM